MPDMNLGVKSPSENWCTSEPFSDAYERILGSENDVVAVITNYQEAKKNPPLRLQLTMSHYFRGSEIADRGLCELARKVRESLDVFGEANAKRAIRLICYANQSDWFCKALLLTLSAARDASEMKEIIAEAIDDFEETSERRNTPPPEEYREALVNALAQSQLLPNILDLADKWVEENRHGAAPLPNSSQWSRFLASPLDGKLGVSLALQWRYNFGSFFRGRDDD